VLALGLAVMPTAFAEPQAPPQPASPTTTQASTQARLKTRWAADVRPDRALPEYPRPQLVRPAWVNLNGQWDYAIAPKANATPSAYDGRILVPYPVESALSGVAKPVSPDQHLWYRRRFTAPRLADGHRLLLHFGAVDWETSVSVNGKVVGEHRGGFDPFTLDITDALRPQGEQELVVRVWDPTDKGPQPRGKQVLAPKSIWYTAVTGIWQTVWLEAVPRTHISALRVDPDIDASRMRVFLDVEGANAGATPVTAHVTILDGTRTVTEARGPVSGSAAGGAPAPIELSIPSPKLWSPRTPFLYGVRVTLSTGDAVESYAGLRKIAVRKDAAGVNRLFLNNEPLFQLGPLDQGWWPDGLYTAPTDEALRFDIEATKRWGFNMIRKHVKVEPARWYYHCDRLGMLVWQDMPSADNTTPEGKEQFTKELAALVRHLRPYPSIVMWVPFNEGWGQHDTERHTAWVQKEDPTRLVNNASGWTDKNVGHVMDIHAYPGPAKPGLEAARASVLGEFGGLGLPVEGHTWLDRGNWGYRSFTTNDALLDAYRKLLYQLRFQIGEGLAAAVYTQTTDVEIEVNGLMTYDRDVIKLPFDVAAMLHAPLYGAGPRTKTVVSSADEGTQAWRYTTSAPADGWTAPGFDASGWTEGAGAFGKTDNASVPVRTPWTTSDLWARRTFELSSSSLTNPHLRIAHDDDAEVWLNGEKIATLSGWTGSYFYVPLDEAGVRALRQGTNTLAIHVKQDKGNQVLDAGLVDVLDAAPRAGR